MRDLKDFEELTRLMGGGETSFVDFAKMESAPLMRLDPYRICLSENPLRVSPGAPSYPKPEHNSLKPRKMSGAGGYPKLARTMSVERGFLIFRRFTELNARSLLYLQAELVHLEQDLLEFTIEDHNAQDLDPQPRRRHELSAMELMESDGQQWKTVLAIREKLDAYSKFPDLRNYSIRLFVSRFGDTPTG
jgi:hypothetical protein